MSPCPGCADKDPLITSAELSTHMPAGVRLPALRMCLDAPSMAAWHVPAGTELPFELERAPARSRRPKKRELGEPTEEEVRMAIRGYLEFKGWDVYDFEQGYRLDRCPSCSHQLGRGHATTRVPKGTPDLYVVGHGVSFWAELKRPGGGDPTPDQLDFHAAVTRHGVRVYVLRSARAAIELDQYFRDHGELPPSGEFPPHLPPPEKTA